MAFQQFRMTTAFEQPPASTFVEVTGNQYGSAGTVTGGTQSGTTFTATIAGYSGVPITSGYVLNISGMSNSVNNGTFTATSASYNQTTGIWTVNWSNASGVTEAGSSGSATQTAGWVGVLNLGVKVSYGVIEQTTAISGQGGSYTYVH